MDADKPQCFAPDLAAGDAMDTPADDAPYHVKARYWRESVMELTRPQLSALTGFSIASIRSFEAVEDGDTAARHRYLMACAAVAMGVRFDWLSASLQIARPVTITMTPPERSAV